VEDGQRRGSQKPALKSLHPHGDEYKLPRSKRCRRKANGGEKEYKGVLKILNLKGGAPSPFDGGKNIRLLAERQKNRADAQPRGGVAKRGRKTFLKGGGKACGMRKRHKKKIGKY